MSSLLPSLLLVAFLFGLTCFLFLMHTVNPKILHNTLKDQTASADAAHLWVARSMTGCEVSYASCGLLSIFVWWSSGIRSRRLAAAGHKNQRDYKDKPCFLHNAAPCARK
jgi:hypothetical protein